MSKNSKRARLSAVPYRTRDRVVISTRYKGALGEKIHGRFGTVAKVAYGPKHRPAKFVWVQLDDEPVTSLVLTFAEELDREASLPVDTDALRSTVQTFAQGHPQ